MRRSAVRTTGRLSVRIGATETGSGLCITYEDDGPGVPHEEKELIFDHEYGQHTEMGLFIAITECGVCGEGARFEISMPQGGYRITPEWTGRD